MLRIEFPEHPFRFKKVEEKEFIFDEFRKAWVRLTPEEWVRQNFLQYLLKTMQYPASMIAVERELKLGELKKRFDILVYDRQHKPWLMVECKAMGIPLEESVLMQVLRYNIAIPVPYLVITNGEFSAGFVKNENTLDALVELPAFL